MNPFAPVSEGSRSTVRRAFLAAAILLATAVAPLHAQPNLNFKRVELDWPTVELYFSVGCNGQQAFDMQRQQFRIFENTVEVKNFTLWCPDTALRCAISTALVLDASGSMSGSGNAYAKAAGRAFIDQMDGANDESAVLWFNQSVAIRQQMTTNRTLLYAAVDNLPAAGGTALWDGVYTGLQELISNGVNQCRAVIVMADGNDEASARTAAEVISLANRNRIRVYAIGIGSAIDPVALSNVAQQTGGRYYQTPLPGELSDLYAEIRRIVYEGFQDCVLTYQRDCADGGLRTVEVRLDYCGGSDVKTKTYRAPLDSATFADMPLKLGDVLTMYDSVFTVPLHAVPDVLPEQLFHPLQFSLRWDPLALEFVGADIPPGSPLAGIRMMTAPMPGTVFVSTADRGIVSGGGALMHFRFRALANPDTAATVLVEGTDGAFDAGCRIPRFDPARVRVVAETLPPTLRCSVDPPIIRLDSAQMQLTPKFAPVSVRVANEGSLPADSVYATIVLPQHFALAGNDAPDRFTKLLYPSRVPAGRYGIAEWTIAYPPAPVAKDYSVQVWTHGTNADSALCEARVSVPALVTPHVDIVGETSFCEGESVALDAGPGFASYRWSTGEDTRAILAGTSGTYFCVMGYPAGGTVSTDTVTVTVWPSPPVPSVQRTGDSLVTVEASGWQWFRDGDVIASATGRRHLCTQPGTYTVEITDSNGCTATSDPFEVTVLGVEPLPETVRSFELFPCPADREVIVHLNLRTPQRVRLVLRDLLGRELRARSVDAGSGTLIRLELDGLHPGTYVVEAQLAGERTARLLIVGR